MSNFAADVPLINEPFVRPDGRVSEAWFMFLIQLFRRSGGTSGSALDDLATDVATMSDDPLLTSLQQSLAAINVQLQTDVPNTGQDALVKAQRAIQDAIIDQLTPIDPIRSMAYQDAARVKITGGSIDGTTIGATTQSTGRFTNVGVGTTTPTYRFVVSNSGAQGVEVDPDGVAFGAGTNGILSYNRSSSAYVPLNISASTLNLRAAGSIKFAVDTNGVGFYGTTPIAKPNVAGSWAGNAAGASLAAALGALGLITNSTTP